MELVPLFSGSSGNATLIRTDNANILIDAGWNCKAIVNALNEVGTNPEDIDAVFITHSHVDHVSGLDVFIRKYPTARAPTEIIATLASPFILEFSFAHKIIIAQSTVKGRTKTVLPLSFKIEAIAIAPKAVCDKPSPI